MADSAREEGEGQDYDDDFADDEFTEEKNEDANPQSSPSAAETIHLVAQVHGPATVLVGTAIHQALVPFSLVKRSPEDKPLDVEMSSDAFGERQQTSVEPLPRSSILQSLSEKELEKGAGEAAIHQLAQVHAPAAVLVGSAIHQALAPFSETLLPGKNGPIISGSEAQPTTDEDGSRDVPLEVPVTELDTIVPGSSVSELRHRNEVAEACRLAQVHAPAMILVGSAITEALNPFTADANKDPEQNTFKPIPTGTDDINTGGQHTDELGRKQKTDAADLKGAENRDVGAAIQRIALVHAPAAVLIGSAIHHALAPSSPASLAHQESLHKVEEPQSAFPQTTMEDNAFADDFETDEIGKESSGRPIEKTKAELPPNCSGTTLDAPGPPKEEPIKKDYQPLLGSETKLENDDDYGDDAFFAEDDGQEAFEDTAAPTSLGTAACEASLSLALANDTSRAILQEAVTNHVSAKSGVNKLAITGMEKRVTQGAKEERAQEDKDPEEAVGAKWETESHPSIGNAKIPLDQGLSCPHREGFQDGEEPDRHDEAVDAHLLRTTREQECLRATSVAVARESISLGVEIAARGQSSPILVKSPTVDTYEQAELLQENSPSEKEVIAGANHAQIFSKKEAGGEPSACIDAKNEEATTSLTGKEDQLEQIPEPPDDSPYSIGEFEEGTDIIRDGDKIELTVKLEKVVVPDGMVIDTKEQVEKDSEEALPALSAVVNAPVEDSIPKQETMSTGTQRGGKPEDAEGAIDNPYNDSDFEIATSGSDKKAGDEKKEDDPYGDADFDKEESEGPARSGHVRDVGGSTSKPDLEQKVSQIDVSTTEIEKDSTSDVGPTRDGKGTAFTDDAPSVTCGNYSSEAGDYLGKSQSGVAREADSGSAAEEQNATSPAAASAEATTPSHNYGASEDRKEEESSDLVGAIEEKKENRDTKNEAGALLGSTQKQEERSPRLTLEKNVEQDAKTSEAAESSSDAKEQAGDKVGDGHSQREVKLVKEEIGSRGSKGSRSTSKKKNDLQEVTVGKSAKKLSVPRKATGPQGKASEVHHRPQSSSNSASAANAKKVLGKVGTTGSQQRANSATTATTIIGGNESHKSEGTLEEKKPSAPAAMTPQGKRLLSSPLLKGAERKSTKVMSQVSPTKSMKQSVDRGKSISKQGEEKVLPPLQVRTPRIDNKPAPLVSPGPSSTASPKKSGGNRGSKDETMTAEEVDRELEAIKNALEELRQQKMGRAGRGSRSPPSFRSSRSATQHLPKLRTGDSKKKTIVAGTARVGKATDDLDVDLCKRAIKWNLTKGSSFVVDGSAPGAAVEESFNAHDTRVEGGYVFPATYLNHIGR